MIGLNEKVVAQWLRHRASVLIQAAEALEESVEPKNGSTPSEHPVLPNLGTITVEGVKKAVTEKAQRIKTLADKFRVPESEVEKIITPANGFEMKGRGWIVLKK